MKTLSIEPFSSTHSKPFNLSFFSAIMPQPRHTIREAASTVIGRQKQLINTYTPSSAEKNFMGSCFYLSKMKTRPDGRIPPVMLTPHAKLTPLCMSVLPKHKK